MIYVLITSHPCCCCVQILATMRKMLSDQEREDIAKRQAKVEAGKRYQRELDAQLTELRTRSFNSLASKLGFILSSTHRTWLFYIYIYISATTIAAITVNVTVTDYTCMCVLRRDDERARDAVQLRPAQEDRRQPITLPRHLGGIAVMHTN